jgi:agmatine deiminase
MNDIYISPEWDQHQGTWFTWPHNQDTWPVQLGLVREELIRIITILSEVEEVHIGINEVDDIYFLERKFKQYRMRSNIFLHYVPSNDAWARDHGAIFGQGADGKRVALKFQFNSWGEKYPPYDKDNLIGKHMAEILGARLVEYDFVLEGGAIDMNGAGRLMTTKDCLLNPNRNPHLSPEEIEERIKYYFNIKNILWLDEGIEGDDTDSHIDELARFVSETRVIIMNEPDASSINYESLEKNMSRLESYQETIKDLEIVKIPMPVINSNKGMSHLPASYANFYIANEIVLVPTFGCREDDQALEILRECFRSRRLIPVNSRSLIEGLGGIHCLTQQIPKIN